VASIPQGLDHLHNNQHQRVALQQMKADDDGACTFLLIEVVGYRNELRINEIISENFALGCCP
jgi:hypothetical protein